MKAIKLTLDWRRDMLRSYSMWSIYLAAICLIVPSIMWGMFGVETNPIPLGWASMVFFITGIAGKPIDQNRSGWLVRGLFIAAFGFGCAMFALSVGNGIYEDQTLPEVPIVEPDQAAADWFDGSGAAELFQAMSKQPIGGGSGVNLIGTMPVSDGEFLEIAVPHTAQWEGKRNKAYLDRIASPPVWTVCMGETRGVKQGDYYTDAQCNKMLGDGLLEYRAALHKYFNDETLTTRLPATRDAAYGGFAWNVGRAGAGRSTAVRRLNAGDIAGGCEALRWWNKAGNRVIQGLVNRRQSEYKLCMIGVRG